MGDNLKQHNPNFIVLQSGIEVWLWVIWSNLCTLAQSLIQNRHLKEEKGYLTRVSIIYVWVQNCLLWWLQLPHLAFIDTASTFRNFGTILIRQQFHSYYLFKCSVVAIFSTEVLLFDWKFLISLNINLFQLLRRFWHQGVLLTWNRYIYYKPFPLPLRKENKFSLRKYLVLIVGTPWTTSNKDSHFLQYSFLFS